MSKLQFIWDEGKALANERKHHVTFDEAKTVFYDDNAELIGDPDHSSHEDRFVMLGMSSRARVLIVCHCYRENNGVIRIISARKATKNERAQYRRSI
ncbi:MAG: hypothetical protein RL518_2261 [Pseudomonadota bacterium]|jgi:uncharacterized DUF497 family protein